MGFNEYVGVEVSVRRGQYPVELRWEGRNEHCEEERYVPGGDRKGCLGEDG
jgi:hypothetical protein